MRIVNYTHYCDLCGTEIKSSMVEKIETNVLFTTEQTEGRPCKPYITKCSIDFCSKCFEEYKRTLIMASGAQGRNDFRFRKSDKNEEH